MPKLINSHRGHLSWHLFGWLESKGDKLQELTLQTHIHSLPYCTLYSIIYYIITILKFLFCYDLGWLCQNLNAVMLMCLLIFNLLNFVPKPLVLVSLSYAQGLQQSDLCVGSWPKFFLPPHIQQILKASSGPFYVLLHRSDHNFSRYYSLSNMLLISNFKSSWALNCYKSYSWQQTVTLKNDICSAIWKIMFRSSAKHFLAKAEIYSPGPYFMSLSQNSPSSQIHTLKHNRKSSTLSTSNIHKWKGIPEKTRKAITTFTHLWRKLPLVPALHFHLLDTTNS